MKKKILIPILILIILLVAASAFLVFGRKAVPAAAGSLSGPKEEEGVTRIEIKIKGHGSITAELDASAAPETVENFLSLVEEKFYDGLTFHRMVSGFVLQGGDPEGTGYGGSEKTVKGEFSANGYENPLSHTRGTLSLARAQDYDSGSSQFFIVLADTPSLDGQYAAFGKVDEESMAVVDEICEGLEPIDSNGLLDPEAQPVIKSIRVVD